MDIAPISGIRGDSLSVPRRTEGIAALQFELMPVPPSGERKHGSQRFSDESEPPYEDAEFIEIDEDEPEPEAASPTFQSGSHIYFVA